MNPARPKILCVDDEPRVLEGLAVNLRRRFEVATATSGAQALAILAAHSVSVVVSDLRMPGMDGVQLLSKMREAAPDTTRILLTGQADLTDRLYSRAHGAYGSMNPFDATDEAGMKNDIKSYVKRLRRQYDKEIREAEAKKEKKRTARKPWSVK